MVYASIVYIGVHWCTFEHSLLILRGSYSIVQWCPLTDNVLTPLLFLRTYSSSKVGESTDVIDFGNDQEYTAGLTFWDRTF